MKILITSLCLFVFTLSFGQNSSFLSSKTKNNPEMKSFGVKIEVDSAEDLEKTFKINDLKNLFKLTAEEQDISLQIICNGETMSDGVKSSLSYKIQGNTSEKENFIAMATKIRKAALRYYDKK